MLNFLTALAFTPVLLGLMWLYTSPLRRLDGLTAVKVIIRIVLFVAVFGGWMFQLNFLGRSEPSNTRRFYVLTLLVIDVIPIFVIGFYRDPHRRRSKSANHTDEEGKNDSRH